MKKVHSFLRSKIFLMLSFVFLVAPAPVLSSCAAGTTLGASIGGGVGAIAGALLDRKNRWRGGVIGGTLGAILGGSITEIARRAAEEAAYRGRPVAYRSRDGVYVQADPIGSYYGTEGTRCHKVHKRIWQFGELREDRIVEICDSRKTTPGYNTPEQW